MKKLSIYIHIPFCDHKCIYCDFYSLITTENKLSYLDEIKTEIEFYANEYSNGREVVSIFFGGGTPSLVEPEYISEILDTLKTHFLISENAEITLETNPGTVDRQKLIQFRRIGINRLSIGIQSFNDNELKFLTRIHNSSTAVKTVTDAEAAGYKNVNIDLIFNLPGQTKKIWQENLSQAMKLPITHISAYSLILERGTILNKMVLDKKVVLQDDDYDADLYEHTIEYLTQNNFLQYEVSNFAAKGFECIHNNTYWGHGEYLGFGTSAHSFIGNKRWWNFSSLKFYLSEMQKKGFAEAGSEILSSKEMSDEFVMLSLRSKGLLMENREYFDADEWKLKNIALITELESEKFLYNSGNFLKLSPKGYAVCDEILTRFL